MMNEEQNQTRAAAKAGMSEKTARKYRRAGTLPSQMKKERNWRTRTDPFSEVWCEVRELLLNDPELQANTIFDWLQDKYPGKYTDGQLRTLQRKLKIWRATEGPPAEVYFPQQYHPGRQCQSDFTHMDALGITISGAPFAHMLYHFVLPYSNWEAITICFSESFESLSTGLQNALWELGAVPDEHRSDRMSAAVNNLNKVEEFTRRYEGLLNHYAIKGSKTNAGRGNELGDTEQSHHRLKTAVDQALLLRGSRDFDSRNSYEAFLKKILARKNTGRKEKLGEELKVMHRLPARRLDDCRRIKVRVSSFATIRVQRNVYSVSSQLIGENVEARLYAEHLEVWYAGSCREKIPRIRGESRHFIQYRHVIDSLVRKPGAFANYRYREDLFPSSVFRMAYDQLKSEKPSRADREYLQILFLAAQISEEAVEAALRSKLSRGANICSMNIKSEIAVDPVTGMQPEIQIDSIDLSVYDALLENLEVA